MNMLGNFQINCYGVFRSRQEFRTENTIIKYLLFDYFGGSLKLKTDKDEIWSNPPAEGQTCQIKGICTTSNTGEIILSITDYVPETSSKFVQPSEEEYLKGISVRGIASLRKSYRRKPDRIIYILRLDSVGISTNVEVTEEAHNQAQEGIYQIQAYLDSEYIWNNQRKSYSTKYNMILENIAPIKKSKPENK